jgi:hypothetical protein
MGVDYYYCHKCKRCHSITDFDYCCCCYEDAPNTERRYCKYCMPEKNKYNLVKEIEGEKTMILCDDCIERLEQYKDAVLEHDETFIKKEYNDAEIERFKEIGLI